MKYRFIAPFQKHNCERWIKRTYPEQSEKEHIERFNEIVNALIEDVKIVSVLAEKIETWEIYESKINRL